jgi:hypothetical protein
MKPVLTGQFIDLSKFDKPKQLEELYTCDCCGKEDLEDHFQEWAPILQVGICSDCYKWLDTAEPNSIFE